MTLEFCRLETKVRVYKLSIKDGIVTIALKAIVTISFFLRYKLLFKKKAQL